MKSYKFRIISAPVCTGSPSSGSEFAYSRLISLGLADIFPDARFCKPGKLEIDLSGDSENMRQLGMVTAISQYVREMSLEAYALGEIPIVIGGDHSIAMGSLAAAGEYHSPENLSLIYIDGHTDINTDKTSSTGFIHGMPLAAASGLCCDALTIGKNKINIYGENIHLIGARSIDPPEYDIIRSNNVNLYEAGSIGFNDAAIKAVKASAGKKLHISLDVDCMSKDEFSSTGYLMDGGMTFDQVIEALRTVISRGDVRSFEIVEYNPTLDPDNTDGKKMLRLLGEVRSLFLEK